MTIRSYLEHAPKLGANCYVDPLALVSGQVELGDDVSIWPMVVLRGDVNWITVGDRTNIQDGACCHTTHPSKHFPHGYPLQIANDVTIGHKVTLHGCMIGEQCLIGIDCTVLDGAIIEPHVMLGAGSLVPPGKILESGYLWIGRPAIKKRALTPDELEFLGYNVRHYVQLKNNYLGDKR
jgi:carbonic anhydrase/acetyltransferase-like protein (isoleucine patch superfamily)